jgi:tetratricopeptide (TPR) repeat protein
MRDGSQAYQHGDFEQAVERWTEAEAAYEKSAARPEQIDALIRLSEAYQSLGRYRTAAIRLDQAKALAAGTDDALLTIRILWRTGSLYQAAGQHEEAERSLQESLRLAKTLPQAALTAAILNDLGNLAASQGKFDDALAAYTESFQTAQAASLKLLAATSLVNAARVSLPSKQYRESKQRLDQATGILRGLEPSHEQISAFITVGLTYAKLRAFLVELNKDLTLASFQALHDAARAADQLGDRRASSFAWGYLGKLYEDERRYAEALGVTQQAILMGQQAAAPEALYRWQWQAGRVLKALGRPKEAIDSYRQAIVAVQSIRPEVSAAIAEDQPDASFRETVGAVYFELADLLLRGSERDADPQHQEAVLREARDTVELFKVAELQDYFQDDCVQAARSHATGLELVSKTAAVIYPIMLQDRLEILVSLPSGMVRKTVPVGAEALTEEIRAFRDFLEKRSTRQYLSHAKKLYGWLIQPIEPLWADAGIDTLVIVPDGALRTIPLAALHDGTISHQEICCGDNTRRHAHGSSAAGSQRHQASFCGHHRGRARFSGATPCLARGGDHPATVWWHHPPEQTIYDVSGGGRTESASLLGHAYRVPWAVPERRQRHVPARLRWQDDDGPAVRVRGHASFSRRALGPDHPERLRDRCGGRPSRARFGRCGDQGRGTERVGIAVVP